MTMTTRLLSINPDVNEGWLDFATRLQANLQALGRISIVSFDVSRRESARSGMGFAATVMYRATTQNEGTIYRVYAAQGEPADAEASLNAQLTVGRFLRARFARSLVTGNIRTLTIGLIVLVDTLAQEPMERAAQTAMFILAPGQTIPAAGSAVVSIVNKDMTPVGTITVHNPTVNAVVTSEAPGLAFKDPETGLWYHYPACY